MFKEARLRRRLSRELDQNPAFAVMVLGRSWLCPFCGEIGVRGRRQADGLDDAVLEHLEQACTDWHQFEGDLIPLATLKAKAQRLEFRHHAKRSLIHNAAWKLADVNRVWYCPFCARETEVTVPQGQRHASAMVDDIVEHLVGCFAYARGKGKEKPFDTIRKAISSSNRLRKLAESVRSKLEHDSSWSQRDDQNRWICLYCGNTQDHIDLSSKLLREQNAPRFIAQHLIGACERFKEDRPSRRKPGLPEPPTASEMAPLRTPIESADTQMETSQLPPREIDPAETTPLEHPPAPASVAPTPPRGPGLPSTATDTAPWAAATETNLNLHKAAGHEPLNAPGTTIEKLESSGEMVSIDHPDLRPPSRKQKRRGDTQSVWREEIKVELERVKSRVRENRDLRHRDIHSQAPPTSISGSQDPTAHIPVPRGFELRVCYKPPTKGQPSTEFLDFHTPASDRIVMVVGSVAGNDSESGLVSAMARNLVKIHTRDGKSPASILSQVNADIFGDLDARTFVSLFLGILEPSTRRLQFARAGLTPPCLIRQATDEFTVLEPEGMVMGIDRGPIFDSCIEEREVIFQPGDLLAQFSNRLPEIRSGDQEEFGIERMHRVLKRYSTHEAAYLCYKFDQVFEEFVKGAQRRDELVLVALRANPDAEG